jgi:hypothetical protein
MGNRGTGSIAIPIWDPKTNYLLFQLVDNVYANIWPVDCPSLGGGLSAMHSRKEPKTWKFLYVLITG